MHSLWVHAGLRLLEHMAEGQKHAMPGHCVLCSAVQLQTCRSLACAGPLPPLLQAVSAMLLRQGVPFRSAANE